VTNATFQPARNADLRKMPLRQLTDALLVQVKRGDPAGRYTPGVAGTVMTIA